MSEVAATDDPAFVWPAPFDFLADPNSEAQCPCCRGQRWWREAREPEGWRCWACHPPAHLPAWAMREMQA